MDINGTCVCRLAKGFAPPDGGRCLSARVGAIITRTAEDSNPEYRDLLKADHWEVVLPEFVWEPAG